MAKFSLDEKILKSFKAKLEKEQKLIEQELGKLKKYEDYGTSDDANAVEMEEWQENLALRQNLQKMLDDAQAALKRIAENKYGYCGACKKFIALERLKASLSTRFCVNHEPKQRLKAAL